MDDTARVERGAAPEFVTRVGERIRRLRKTRGWTVHQLAEVSGVSRRMLTDVELGRANPSLVTLDRIARALNTDFAALSLPDVAPRTAESAFAPTAVWRDGLGSEALLLGATRSPRAELWQWILVAGARYDAQPDRAGAQELHHVLTGRLRLELTTGPVLVEAGQTVTIASDHPYAYVNDTDIAVVFFRVVTGA